MKSILIDDTNFHVGDEVKCEHVKSGAIYFFQIGSIWLEHSGRPEGFTGYKSYVYMWESPITGELFPHVNLGSHKECGLFDFSTHKFTLMKRGE